MGGWLYARKRWEMFVRKMVWEVKIALSPWTFWIIIKSLKVFKDTILIGSGNILRLMSANITITIGCPPPIIAWTRVSPGLLGGGKEPLHRSNGIC